MNSNKEESEKDFHNVSNINEAIEVETFSNIFGKN